MNRTESAVYAVLIILSLIAAGLAIISPAEFINLKVVYGGF